ncbi:MAG: hypothetical protein ACT4PL_11815 [Phycisphaerales bacterium]
MRAFSLGFASVALFATIASAQVPDDFEDVGIKVEGGRIVTKAMTEPFPGGVTFSDGRVFGGEFFVQGGQVFTDEPGFFAQDATLPAGSRFGFNIRRSLRVWNGLDFDSVAPERIRFEFDTASATTPLSDMLTPGLDFEVPSSGGFDQHFDTFLLDAMGSNAPAAGVYLVEIELTSTALPLGTSLPVFLVFGNDASEAALDAAREYVETVLVPSPGVASVALGMMLVMRRRRARA